MVIVLHCDPAVHPVAPERSADQRTDALNGATEIRTRRAQLKRHLKAGRTSITTLLLDPPAWLQTAKMLDSCRISPSKTLGGLTDRQRSEIAARLGR